METVIGNRSEYKYCCRIRTILRYLLVVILFFSSSFSFAQEADSIRTVKPGFGRVSSLVDIQDLVSSGFKYWNDDFSGHWSGVFFGVNGLLNADYSSYPDQEKNFLDYKLRKSNSLQVNFLQWSVGLQRNRNTIGLVTGLGLGFQSYHLNNQTTLIKADDGRIHPSTFFFDDNQKSKFSMVSINLPLLLEFQVPVSHYANRLYLSGGLVASRRLSSHTKIKYRRDGQKQKLKSPGDFSQPDYKYAAMVRLGYRWINLYASYDLNSMFRDDLGPEVHPFSLGIALLSFK